MSNNSNKDTIVVIVIVVIWLFGLFAGNKILKSEDSYYPMLDENTENPNYSKNLHDRVSNIMIWWTFICIGIGFVYFYFK